MSRIMLFAASILMSVSGLDFASASPGISDELTYSCIVDRAQPYFPTQFELQLERTGRYVNYMAPDGENCQGSRDDNYRQRLDPKNPRATKFIKYFTDCEGDGFLEVLVSDSLLKENPPGIAKIRTHRERFTEVFYSCKAL